MSVLSNRADLISGGDALVAFAAPAGVEPQAVSLSLNGKSSPATFKRMPNGQLGSLLTGLELGANAVVARFPGGSAATTIVNHPAGGPVFSGPQLMPWLCRNSGAVDAQCNQPVEYRYAYKSSNPLKAGMQTYDPGNPPTDVAQITTENGLTLPFIVRIETGYMDRDQYQIAALYQVDQAWTATEPQPQFNHKLVINHGFGCGVEYQTASAPAVAPGAGTAIPVVGGQLPIGLPLVEVLTDATEVALGKGFAVMSTALDNSSHNCNVALQAESLVMAKERVVEQYGDLRYTIGQGCSGGSLAMQWISNAYPGIYQGILPTCSFPDAWSTATQFADYHLLLAYFQDPSRWGAGVLWLPTQMGDVMGHLSLLNAIVSENAQFHVAVATDPCGGTTDETRYHPTNNPAGVRCTVMDAAINLLGPRQPEDWGEVEKQLGRGFAGFPVDNVGVQYGLGALRAGLILPAQFVDLNVAIGGLDIDTKPIPSRTPAAQPALANAYRTGLINETNNLDQTAIIDCRGPDPGAFHDAYRAFAIRARLDREHGNHDNQVIWEGPLLIMGDNECARNSFAAMDAWLAAVEQDLSPMPLALKLTTHKPTNVVDACYDGLGQRISAGLCPELIVPVYGTPRTVAGDAISTDTNKCQLKPLDRNDDYGLLPFTDAQWASLSAVFPEGVCDYSKPGVSQQGTIPWQTYQGPLNQVIYGGTPLPPAPANSGTAWAGPAFQVFTH
ncbi:hypothetical protein ED208_08940 [Stagnimonas aquatica]|uniref:DUF6351 domain-containing protein n=1 Tax=Stagnimonas aquatica TaxID=2689987 RepID=A0A3N0VED8_9GAMM|nr:DUF6351 family protein [Stagnimonas aquatica]ROH91080.1 hypothetical protein ED208_08940 [Stagnimonas aquatica]